MFKIGDRIWYLCPRQVKGKPTKITDTWLGPYNIKQKKAKVLYTIKPGDYEGPEIVVHTCRLVLYQPGETSTKSRIPARLHMNDHGDEMAKVIWPPFEMSEQEVKFQLG